MSKLKTTFILVFVLLAFMITACSNTKTQNNQLPESKPKDFNFVLNYGINAKNQLDTAKEQFTKDMITEPSITTNLKFTDEEMNTIYLEMRKSNILSYPENYDLDTAVSQKPFEEYSIKISFDGKEKIINWKQTVTKTKEAVQLRELVSKIRKIIDNKEEFEKLPEPKGGYL
jgi:biopolymer transport protein ExbD